MKSTRDVPRPSGGDSSGGTSKEFKLLMIILVVGVLLVIFKSIGVL